MQDTPAPNGLMGTGPLLARHVETVPAEWTDYNGHMNVAFYVLAFDHATDVLLDELDLGEAYRQRARMSVFVVETHVNYLQEVDLGDRLAFTTRVLGGDDKRMHIFHHMYRLARDAEPELVATNEIMTLHVSLETRGWAPFDPATRDRIAAMARAHGGLAPPDQAGRRIAPLGGGPATSAKNS